MLHIHDGMNGILTDNKYENPNLKKYHLTQERKDRYRRPSRFGIRRESQPKASNPNISLR